MKKLLSLFLGLLIFTILQAQTVTLPPYYGVQSSTFKCGISTVLDYEENVYHTVKIGDQCWLKENLRSTKYNDGTSITIVTDGTTWASLTTPAYCWYNNDYATYGSVYGALYNWYTVDTEKLCPIGWHVPSDTEWIQLTDYLGGENVAGGKLKEAGTEHWPVNIGGTNESGFTALPGRYRNLISFEPCPVGCARWWCSTEFDIYGSAIGIMGSGADLDIGYLEKKLGQSIRCVKD